MLDTHQSGVDHEVDTEFVSGANKKDGDRAPKKGSAFRERLKREGVPILLEGYMKENPWTVQQVARDIWQNFFDSNEFTADGIVVDLQNNPDGTVTVTVKGDSSYPFNRLAVMGAGYKSDRERSAGGKHEGSKVLNLALLRDFGCSEVVYSSDDWEMRFYLDEPEEGVVDEEMGEQRMMYARLTDRPKQKGSFCRFTTTPEVANEVVGAKDFFNHSENKDFVNPDIDNDKVGCRVHPGKKGNFYLNGQRVSYATKGDWETVPGFTLWSKETPRFDGEQLVLGRDRDVVNSYEFQHIFLPFFIESLDKIEAELLFGSLDDYLDLKDYDTDREIGIRLVRLLCGKIARTGKKLDFDDSWLAGDTDKAKRDMFVALGYRVCQPELAKIGMRSISEALQEALDLQKIKPNKKERARVKILEDTMKKFFAAAGSDIVIDARAIQEEAKKEHKERVWYQAKISDVSFKPIGLFTRKGMLSGRFGVDEVMMARDGFRDTDPSSAVATYLHEVCHTVGTDESAEFSYALTAILRRWTKYLMENFGVLSDFKQAWDKVNLLPGWETVEEMLEEINPLIEELEERTDFRREEAIEQIGLRAGHRVAEKISEIFKGQEFSLAELRALYRRMNDDVWADYCYTRENLNNSRGMISATDRIALAKLANEVYNARRDKDATALRLKTIESELRSAKDKETRDLLNFRISQLKSDLEYDFENLTNAKVEYNEKRMDLGDSSYLTELESLLKDFTYNGVGEIDFHELTNPTYLLFAWLEIRNVVYKAPSGEVVVELGEMLDFLNEISRNKNDFDFSMLLGLKELLAAAEVWDEPEKYLPAIRKIYDKLTKD